MATPPTARRTAWFMASGMQVCSELPSVEVNLEVRWPSGREPPSVAHSVDDQTWGAVAWSLQKQRHQAC